VDYLIQIINLLISKWYLSLIIGGSLEGLSVPFPSQPLVLYIGHLINMKKINFALAGIIFAVPYTVASCIPYLIGLKCGKIIDKVGPRYQWYLSKGEEAFTKYGDLAVLVMRPFAAGNYISYVAGLYRMSLLKYLTYTFLGIYLWSLVFLYLGGQLALRINVLINMMMDNIKEGILIFAIFLTLASAVFLLAKYLVRVRSS
jgi:membrane protein DedA with SNARE-associated domain